MRCRRTQTVERHIDLPGNQAGQHRPVALVRNVSQFNAVLQSEQFARQVVSTADGGRTAVDLTRIGLGFFKEFLDVFYWQLRGIHHDDLRRLSQQGIGREVYLYIVVQLLVERSEERRVGEECDSKCRSGWS